MPSNPIVNNEGGFYRFQDYLAQVPEFLTAEPDVVLLLQLFSDYLNNAYRNASKRTEFEMIFVSTNASIGIVKNRVNQLIELMTKCEEKGLPILFLSKPEGNPNQDDTYPLFRDYIDYAGQSRNISADILEYQPNDGDKFYVNYTDVSFSIYSGVYYYDLTRNQLLLDPTSTSQDPFNNTQNKPFKSIVGIVPRILQLKLGKIGSIGTRFSYKKGSILYYELFFSLNVLDILDVTSTYIISDSNRIGVNNPYVNPKDDFLYLVDYYHSVKPTPVAFRYHYWIKFATDVCSFNWQSPQIGEPRTIPGFSLFYARDLSENELNPITKDRQEKYSVVDPIFTPNNEVISLESTTATTTTKAISTTKWPHGLSVGDLVTIKDTQYFDGATTVDSIINAVQFQFGGSFVSASVALGGECFVNDFWYSKNVNKGVTHNLIVPFVNAQTFIPLPFKPNTYLARLDSQDPNFSTSFNGMVDVDVDANAIRFAELGNLMAGDKVIIIPSTASTLPGGLLANTVYTISNANSITRYVTFQGTPITSIGSGTIIATQVNWWFNASMVNVNPLNEIPVSTIENLSIGQLIEFTTTTPTAVMPGGITTGKLYIIESINSLNNTIKLVDVTITSIGVGDIILTPYIQGQTDAGYIGQVVNNIFGFSGSFIMASYSGNLITHGWWYVKLGGELAGVGRFDSDAVLWERGNLYPTGSYVVYQGIRYLVNVSIKTDSNSVTPDKDLIRYTLAMNALTNPDFRTIFNKYMFGLYFTKNLKPNTEIDYVNTPYSELTSTIYIQPTKETFLKYGWKQRDWWFDPTTATKTMTKRNGYIVFTAINSDDTLVCNQPIINNIPCYNYGNPVINSIEPFIKAIVTQFMDLRGLVPIVMPIEFATQLSGVATITTSTPNGYKIGASITINGSTSSYWNGTFKITSIINTQKFTIDVDLLSPNTMPGTATSNFLPQIGDYVRVNDGTGNNVDGYYVAEIENWRLVTSDVISDGATVFSRTNLFTADETNPSLAQLSPLTISSLYLSTPTSLRVQTFSDHRLKVGGQFEIRQATPSYFNGFYEVINVYDAETIDVNFIKQKTYTKSATVPGVMYRRGWYRFELNSIQWQQRSRVIDYNENPLGKYWTIAPLAIQTFQNNVLNPFSEFDFEVLTDTGSYIAYFRNGDYVQLSDQLAPISNGLFRVRRGLTWERLTIHNSMKVRDIDVDSYENLDYDYNELTSPIVYRIYGDDDVDDMIRDESNGNHPIYKADILTTPSFEFIYESIPNIDTAGNYPEQYSAYLDKNSVVEPWLVTPGFTGVPDMRYPLIEKVERLMYLKDWNVIDIDLIGYLARYIGYDITTLTSDINENPFYNNTEERNKALRQAVMNLPQFYTLKSTEPGLKMLLATYGAIGEIVKMWTRTNDPYKEFIEEGELKGQAMNDAMNNTPSFFQPIPHFTVKLDVNANSGLSQDEQRLHQAIMDFKPINTYFDGLVKYLQDTAQIRVQMGPTLLTGKSSWAVGYNELNWDDLPEDMLSDECL